MSRQQPFGPEGFGCHAHVFVGMWSRLDRPHAPGPWRMPATFDPTPALAEAAVKHGVHTVFGTIAPLDPAAATAHNLIVMAYPDGRAPARYRRTHPNGPWIYTGG